MLRTQLLCHCLFLAICLACPQLYAADDGARLNALLTAYSKEASELYSSDAPDSVRDIWRRDWYSTLREAVSTCEDPRTLKQGRMALLGLANTLRIWPERVNIIRDLRSTAIGEYEVTRWAKEEAEAFRNEYLETSISAHRFEALQLYEELIADARSLPSNSSDHDKINTLLVIAAGEAGDLAMQAPPLPERALPIYQHGEQLLTKLLMQAKTPQQMKRDDADSTLHGTDLPDRGTSHRSLQQLNLLGYTPEWFMVAQLFAYAELANDPAALEILGRLKKLSNTRLAPSEYASEYVNRRCGTEELRCMQSFYDRWLGAAEDSLPRLRLHNRLAGIEVRLEMIPKAMEHLSYVSLDPQIDFLKAHEPMPFAEAKGGILADSLVMLIPLEIKNGQRDDAAGHLKIFERYFENDERLEYLQSLLSSRDLSGVEGIDETKSILQSKVRTGFVLFNLLGVCAVTTVLWFRRSKSSAS